MQLTSQQQRPGRRNLAFQKVGIVICEGRQDGTRSNKDGRLAVKGFINASVPGLAHGQQVIAKYIGRLLKERHGGLAVVGSLHAHPLDLGTLSWEEKHRSPGN